MLARSTQPTLSPDPSDWLEEEKAMDEYGGMEEYEVVATPPSTRHHKHHQHHLPHHKRTLHPQQTTRAPKSNKKIPLPPEDASGYPCTCSEGTMDCRDQELKTTFITPQPRLAKMKVTRLYLEGNRITGIFRNFILGDAHRQSLHHLDLRQNDICYIEAGAFTDLPALGELILSFNRLEGLAENTFGYIPHLRELRLDNNRLSNLTGPVFEDLEDLRLLILSDNPIQHMDAMTFRGLSRLEELDLENTALSFIGAEWFSELSRLRTLKLNRNHFMLVPSLHNLPRLSVLDLSHNPIYEVTRHAFEGLTRLRELMLNHMPRMHTVEDCGFCDLRRLQVLQMFNNSQLYFVDEEAFGDPTHMKALKTIDWENNNLSHLSKDLLLWENLTSIKLGGSNPWDCTCRLAWMSDARLRFQGQSPRCFHPGHLHGHTINMMAPEQFCEGGGYSRSGGGFSVGKIFVGLTVLLLLTALLALLWFCWLNKGGRVAGSAALPTIRKRRTPHYHYRNLAMAEELDEAGAAPADEDDLYSRTNVKVPPAVEL